MHAKLVADDVKGARVAGGGGEVQPVLRAPLLPHVGGGAERGTPVDARAASQARPRQHRDTWTRAAVVRAQVHSLQSVSCDVRILGTLQHEKNAYYWIKKKKTTSVDVIYTASY